jgi:superfamily II DNA or RNA helicase
MTARPRLSDLRWGRALPSQATARGIDYALEGRVFELEPLDRHGLHWQARVRGGRAQTYRTEVQVVPAAGRAAPRVISRCTCPLQGLCKHVAAVLHSAQMMQEDAAHDDVPGLERAQGTGQDPGASDAASTPAAVVAGWDRWLQRLARPTAALATEPSDLGLLLRVSEQGSPAALLAALVAFKPGKREQRTEPQTLFVRDGHPSAAPTGGWPEEDLLAAMLLLERQTERVGPMVYAIVRGRAMERAFEQLLARYPAFLERAAQPVTPAPPRRLVLRWDDLPDGRQQLGYRPDDGSNPRVLLLDGLWYLDEEAASIGRLEGNRQLLELTPAAPPLEPEAVPALRARLQQGALPVAIPAPVERAAPRALVVAPRPVLMLRQLAAVPNVYGGRNDGRILGVARLAFDYGGERLAAGGAERERRLRGGELREIVRDRATEQRLAERVRELDLVAPGALPWPLSYSYAHLGNDHLLLAPGRNREPQPPEAWAEPLRQLAAERWQIEYEAGFPRPLREVEAGDWDAELSSSGSAWFDLSLGIEIDGRRTDLLPILRQVLADPKFPLRAARDEKPGASWRIALDDERALRLPLAKLRTLLAPLLDWLQQDKAVRLHRSQGELLRAIEGSVRWRGDAGLRERLVDLRAGATSMEAPPGFLATLRPYQREGLAWLELLAQAGLGGVLADDMGLGKTVQVLAHVLAQRQRAGADYRVLVVAPTSLVGNWRDEAARFAPQLRILVLHGPDRADRYDDIATHDLILTTYPLLPRDRERLLQYTFDLLVLDEAQAIKNARSLAARVVRELRATRRLAMTGTPLENHLGELWAQFDAVEPGLLGNERDFTRWYRTPIEKQGDLERQQRLHRRIGSLLLRRRKDEVLQDLPPKTEVVRMLDLDGAQRELYETLRLAQHARVREAIAERGLAQSGIVVLDALLKLRQACCDPRLVPLPAARKVKESAKLDALLALLRTLHEEGRRVLLFSQFTTMLDLIEPALAEIGIEHLRLDGSTPGPSRAALVRRYQQGEVPLFLISLKAGGVGLNLTAADTVIHYDPWWNPAVERQASDRAHRIGQDKPVFVYKLICSGTVEEKILALQTRKAELAQAVLEGGRSTRLRFDEDDLSELFAPMR